MQESLENPVLDLTSALVTPYLDRPNFDLSSHWTAHRAACGAGQQAQGEEGSLLTAPKDSLPLGFAPRLGSGSSAPAPVRSALARAQIQRARETQMLG